MQHMFTHTFVFRALDFAAKYIVTNLLGSVSNGLDYTHTHTNVDCMQKKQPVVIHTSFMFFAMQDTTVTDATGM